MLNRKQKSLVARIIELKNDGMTYKQVDTYLNLPFKSYRFMNSRKVKALLASA